MPELVFFRRNEELMRFSVEERTTVGRGSTNDVQVPDPAVSRQQFEIDRDGDLWRLKDLSGKGTEISGKQVSEGTLQDGSDIGLGQWRVIFNLSSTGFSSGATEGARAGGTEVVPREADTISTPAWLKVIGADREQMLPFQSGMTIGSGEAAAVRVEDPFVSANHLKLERRDGGFVIRDLASKNGTFVGPTRVWEAEVSFDCPVRIGSTDVILVRSERTGPTGTFEGMVGSHPSLKRVFETIDRVAPSQAAVSIFGESGTGKELIARAIHARSPRVRRPFIPVNCGALSKELVESELFGHEKGAFTGADRLRKGAFEAADGGTLFLDEIGELPLELQSKLLRALELGEVRRVGASRPLIVDVRLVAATNRDLRAEVRKGTFREDLYWRLCVVPVQVPPLRARLPDLKALTAHFLKLYSPPGTVVSVSAEAEKKLAGHDWPGNVRELRNTVHRVLLLRKGERIEASDISFDRDLELVPHTGEAAGPYDPDSDDLERVFIVGKSLEKIEDEVFLKTCRRLGTRATAVAKALGQSRGAAYRRMDKLGIAPSGGEDRDGGADEA